MIIWLDRLKLSYQLIIKFQTFNGKTEKFLFSLSESVHFVYFKTSSTIYLNILTLFKLLPEGFKTFLLSLLLFNIFHTK